MFTIVQLCPWNYYEKWHNAKQPHKKTKLQNNIWIYMQSNLLTLCLVAIKGTSSSFLGVEHEMWFVAKLLTYLFSWSIRSTTSSSTWTIEVNLPKGSIVSLGVWCFVDVAESCCKCGIGHDNVVLQRLCSLS
jgi:hypothetical protein